MHHTFYGNGKTSCGKPLDGKHKATGIDSLVTCNDCYIELARYRLFFPQASNETTPVLIGENIHHLPVMEGGAR